MPAETNPLKQPVENLRSSGDGIIVASGELDLFAFALLLLRNAWFILGCGLVAFLIMVGVMLHVKPRFASTAVMIVPQGNIATTSLSAQLSANTLDLLGGGYELYADIMKSRTVADRLIKDYDLMNVYHVRLRQDAEAVLAGLTTVQTYREGVIRVTVQDTSPERAAGLANDYLHQLDLLNSSLVLSNIGEQRVFLERELIKEKDALADAEVALKKVQESTTGLPPENTVSASANALQTTRAQLRADEIRLAALRTGETEANPEIVRLRSEIAGLGSQVEAMQNGAESTINGVPTSKVPAQVLEYTRRLREVKFHETLFDLLAKQFDAAKAQEAKTPSIVEVLDPGDISNRKAWPPRTFYCVLAGVAGTLLGIFLVALRAFATSYLRAPRNEVRLQQLRDLYGSILPRKS